MKFIHLRNLMNMNERRERNRSQKDGRSEEKDISSHISPRQDTKPAAITTQTTQENKYIPTRPPRPKTSLHNLRPKVILSPQSDLAKPEKAQMRTTATIDNATHLVPSSSPMSMTRDHAISFSEDVFAALHPYLHPETETDRRLRTWHGEVKYIPDTHMRHSVGLGVEGSIPRSQSDNASQESYSTERYTFQEYEKDDDDDNVSNTSQTWTYRPHYYPEDKHISSWALEDGERKASLEIHAGSVGNYSAHMIVSPSRNDNNNVDHPHYPHHHDHDQIATGSDIEQGQGIESSPWRKWYIRYRRRIWMVMTIILVVMMAAAITGGIMWRLMRCK
ncbi:hypothetical protein B0A52_02494 [Exophiala mesophila]|uniref:Uncharacterized protein n=1 Tax=Exophiala mesophila TaxID=212818 RepID=A0A438ND79_EXOME|nr:hypothetical protein B0A52_02494 [Exophiala mesophila]